MTLGNCGIRLSYHTAMARRGAIRVGMMVCTGAILLLPLHEGPEGGNHAVTTGVWGVPRKTAETRNAKTKKASADKGHRLAWTILLLAFVGASLPAAADPTMRTRDWALPQLMATMQAVHTATAHFTERKFEHLLKQPLQSSGILMFVAPDRLQKQTLAPAASRLTVDGDHLRIEQPDGKVRNLLLSEVPEIGALVASIRATLAGDTATLTRYYTTMLTGSAGDWSLLLQPKDPRLRDLLTMIRMRGEGSQIRSIETVERDGDRTEMTIMPDSG